MASEARAGTQIRHDRTCRCEHDLSRAIGPPAMLARGGRRERVGTPGFVADLVIQPDRRNVAGTRARSPETPWTQTEWSWRHRVSFFPVTETHSPTANAALYTSNGRAVSTAATPAGGWTGFAPRCSAGIGAIHSGPSRLEGRSTSTEHLLSGFARPPRCRPSARTLGLTPAGLSQWAVRMVHCRGAVPEPCYCCPGSSPSRLRRGVPARWRWIAVLASMAAGPGDRRRGRRSWERWTAGGKMGQPLVKPRDE